MSVAARETEQADCQLYLISPAWPAEVIEPCGFAPLLEAALDAAGAAAFRLRTARTLPAHVRALQQICAGRAAFLIQDDLGLALELGADGVHLSDPARVGDARARLGPDRIIGASCGHSRHVAMLAGDDGADYIAFGELGCALQPPLLELIAWWSALFVLPCLAEGAFDVTSCAPLVGAGADFIGVSEAVWHHADGAARGAASMRAAIDGA